MKSWNVPIYSKGWAVRINVKILNYASVLLIKFSIAELRSVNIIAVAVRIVNRGSYADKQNRTAVLKGALTVDP